MAMRKCACPSSSTRELFKRAIGEHTDVVSKEMYTFEDQGGESLTLRPEATAGMVRAAHLERHAARAALEALVLRADVPARDVRRRAATASSISSMSKPLATPGRMSTSS